jgi:hypothetical protein
MNIKIADKMTQCGNSPDMFNQVTNIEPFHPETIVDIESQKLEDSFYVPPAFWFTHTRQERLPPECYDIRNIVRFRINLHH